MADVAEKRMTVEEFFQWCDTQEGRWELVDGVPRPVFPMEQLQGERHPRRGPTFGHQQLQAQAHDLVRRHAKPPRWSVTAFGVRIGDHGTREPDIVLTAERVGMSARYTTAPLLVVEIISPSTEREDRTAKLDEYKSLSSMREIWLVSSTRRWVQVWQRRDDGRWHGEDVIGTGSFESAVLEDAVGLVELYAGVEIEAG